MHFILEIHKNSINKEFDYNGKFLYGYWYLSGENINIKKDKLSGKFFIRHKKNSLKDNAYEIDVKVNSITILPDLWGIYPIYYYAENDNLIVSNSIFKIKETLKNNISINQKYILEQNLFNYSFSENTIHKEIKLVPSGFEILITENISFKPIFSIEDYFTDNPIKQQNSIVDLVEKFIYVNKTKISDNDYISFTSGFDGRSLVSLGKYLKKEFSTFSFGTEENEDLYLPREQAEKLGMAFYPIKLDSEEYSNEFWNLGTDIIIKSAAATNFLQVHWAYSAKLLSNETKTLISGVFGSELFRAAHTSGQFASPALVDYFKNIETDEWINKIKNADSLKFINKDNFKNEMEELIEELNDYKKKIIHLIPSQRFYKYIIDEVFRKFFGMQFLFPQSEYLNVITPYLDFEFVKELLKTELAGVNNEFFTHNPLKRFKGQLFYAKLIEKTYPELSRLTTGKGYKPLDLFSFLGKANITYNFFKKRIKRNVWKINLNNLGIISAYEHNKTKFENIPIIDEYYIPKYIKQLQSDSAWHFNEISRNKFMEALSTNYYLNEIK